MMVGRGDNIGPDKCHYKKKQFRSISSFRGWAGIRWFVSACVLMCVVVSPCGAIRFTGERETYSKYPQWNACVNASIQFEFKTVQRDALLMYTDKNNRYDYLQVILTEGSVLLWINFRSESDQNLTINLGKNLNDGKWHSVEVKRNRMETTLQVDKTQYSKVAFGSDDDAYIDRIEKHNFMYFGGLPARHADTFGREALPTAVRNSQFEGEIRNIMYFNCSCLPTRPSALESKGTRLSPPEACDLTENKNRCPQDCMCVSSDDDVSGCDCMYRGECIKDLLASYILPMDIIEGDLIQNPSGLASRVYGNPELVQGVREMALKLDGRSQWIRVSGPDHKTECFGDLAHCPTGYYVGLWVQFQSPTDQKAVYMSNGGHSADGHGIAMSYSKRGLEFVFKSKDGKEWKVLGKDVLPGIWYHVAASWAKDKGLHLYINGAQVAHHQAAKQTAASPDGGQYKDFVIGRSNDRTGTGSLGLMLVDDFHFISSFKSQHDMREEGPAFRYYLPMDRVVGDKLEMDGGEAKVSGTLPTVPGKIGQAVSFTSRGEYIDLGDASKKCLGDFEKCKNGFYISFFIMFKRLDSERSFIFSSPHGMEIFQAGSQLAASAQSDRNIWEVRYNGLNFGIWYFVEVSWSEDGGISLYVDGVEVDRQIRERSIREPRITTEMKAFIGRSNDGGRREQLDNAELDEMNIFYGTREMLQSIGFIQTERPPNYHINFEDVRGNRLLHDKLLINLIGSPVQTGGKVGRALQLDGNNDYVDFNDRTLECIGNLDLCQQGSLYSMWIRPDKLRNNMYLLSTGNNGVTLRYRNGALHASAETSTRKWETTTSNLEENKWYFLEVSFHPDRGLSLYVNNERVAEDTSAAARADLATPSPENNRFYLGRGNTDMSDSRYGEATYDEMDMWQADRDFLTAHEYIQRSRPHNFLIDFEELVGGDRIRHPDLNIILQQGPVLIPGKVKNALELSGRGQFADLGRRNDECMTNLALCTQGITVAAWMRFHRFENNMVFLSTGDNGILMMYKDGYIQVTAAGRGIITTPKFETDRWYFVEVSWHPESGLKLYVDNELRGESEKLYVPPGSSRGNFYLGVPNQADALGTRFTHGIFDVDEMEIWYGKREDLLAFGYINRDNLGYESFSFDNAEGRRILHTKYDVLLYGDASLAPGRFGNAVSLRGRGQYVDLGTHYQKCFGNLDLCSHGLTLSMWLNPKELREGTTFLSTPTYNVNYQNGRLRSEFRDRSKTWSTSSIRIRPEEWQKLTMAWHPRKGLSMYINDELVDQDRQGLETPQQDQPASEHIYLGRALASDRVTANMLADELQVWYDDLDQLRATGQYKVQVLPINILFNEYHNNLLRIRDREIRGFGDIQLGQGKGRDHKAIYLIGTDGYLDLGANFTCGGNLETCSQGTTIRLGLNPTSLQNNMVFLDSFPVKLYYKDNKLYGQFQTGTQLWTVSTLDFRPGQWQRVELTWHPREGLTMYIDGRRVDQETYPSEQTSQLPTDWRTYFGRALQGGKTYANTGVDSIEFWTAHRDDLPEDKYLRIPFYPPPTPRPTDDTIIITGSGIDDNYEVSIIDGQTPAPERRRVKILVFDGQAYVTFNFDKLPPRFLQRTDTEDFQFYFLSRKPNGLIWLQEDRDRKMYLALRDGNLVFVNDDGSGAPEEIPIGRQTGTRFDDGGWHLFKLRRNGRNIKITVDDRHEQNYIFARDVHFLTGGATVYLAGTQNTYESTNGRIRDNLNGGMALVVYRKDVREGNTINKMEVNVISEITISGAGVSSTEIDWGSTERPPITPRPTPAPTPRPRPPPSTTAPVPAVTSITLKEEGHFFSLQEPLSAERGSSLSLKFQTIKDRALILYATSNLVGKNFIALEIYDGKLYFVHNFGGRSKRTLLSDREVSDGQSHEFSLRFHDNQMALTIDGENKRIPLESNEQWPRNLSPINIGGHGPYLMPWHTWARTGYLGCIEDLRINNRLVDWQGFIQAQQLYGIIDATCTAMPRDCSTRRPCVRGYCINKWGGYTCDCRATEFTGQQCETAALTGIFNGNTNYKMTITPTQNYHVNDISFRLRTFASDGLIFQTKANLYGTFLRAELEGGRIKLTTNLGGEEQSFFVGGAVNDNQWHTVFIQRRGNQMEFWMDNEKHFTKILPGEDYFLHVDNVFVGGHFKGELDIPSTIKPFIGYLQNFYFSDFDVFSKISSTGGGNFSTGTDVIIFNDVTFTSYQTHLILQSQYLASGLDINFIFKTKDPNGVILFSEGKDNQLFAVELFNGQLHVKIDIPGKAPLRISTPGGRSFNDGNWHSLSLMTHTVDGQKQLIMTVDDLRSTNSYSLLDQINLQGPLYLGGITEALYQKQNIKEFLSSKAGYRGCLASVGLGKTNPDLYALGQSQNVNILSSCQDIVSQCTKTTCNNGGVCHDHHNNGTTWCDCSKTAYAGPTCTDEPLGYYFRTQGRQDLDGMLVYRYPPLDQGYNEQDEIILGVMTEEKNAVLTKLISDIFNDYVEIKLVNGYVVATYDTDGKGASTITNSDVDISDGRYHIIRFLRTKDKGTLTVDSNIAVNTHASAHGNFDRPNKIFIGGIYQGKKIVSGTGFGGIIGGLYVNGRLIFPYASDNVNTEFYSDVDKAAHPFKLGIFVTAATVKWDTTTTPYIPIVTATPAPPGPFLPILPDDIGGGGIAWDGLAAGAGGTGVNVVVYPGGGGGSAGKVPGVMPGPIDGEVAAAQIGVVPSLPAVGPRAGAVMGTILGLAALASSLMWAFYRCKPGWCTCLKPPAAPLTISTPRSTTNMAAVQAASAGAGGAGAGAGGAGAGGAGAGVDVVDAGVLTGGIKASSSAGQGFGAGSTLYSQQSSSNVHQRSDSYDSATLRATGTFTNKGTAIGTPRMGRHQIGSTTSASASGYSESNAAITPASLQSYHFEGGNSTADYDIASGVHSNYQSNTLNAGGGGGAGGFSTSTMSSNYNYSVQTIRSVGGQQALLGYAAGSTSNVIVTPGAMGEKVRVDCCLMTNDGHSVVTGSSLGPPQVWNMSSGELLRIMQGETVGSTNLHLVCNDRLLVGAINDDLEINQYSTPKGVHNYQFQIWDFASGRPLGMAQSEMCSALTVMSDNDKVVFGRSDKFGGGTNIVVWDLLGNQAIKEMRYDAPVGNNDYISYISLSQNDRYVIAGFNNTFDNFAEFVIFDMTLTSYNISDPNILRLDAAPEVTAILPHDEAVTGLRNGDLVVWSLRTGQPSRQLLSNTGKHAHSREVKAVARSDDNKYLVSASADGTLKVWDLESERHISTMNGHNDEVWCACISSDNEIVVSGSRDITIRLWRLKTGQEICAFNAGVDVFYITMSKDKGTIVALGDKFGARKLIMLQVVRSKVKRQVLA